MIDLERKLLSALSDASALAQAWESGVRAEQFEEPICQAVWEFVVDYWRRSGQESVPTGWIISQEFPGYEPLSGVQEEVFYLSDRLRSRYLTNSLQAIIREVAADTTSDPMGALQRLHSASGDVAEVVAQRNLRVNMADDVIERRERYGQRSAVQGILGAPYGLEMLDLHTGGLLPGELAVIGAVAKTGKSMLGLHIMASALRSGYRPMVFSLEMSLRECEDRLDCMFSGVSYDGLLHGRLTGQEMSRWHEAQEEMAGLGGIQIERPEVGDRTASALLSRARQYGANLIFIDQLSHMEPGQRTNSLKEHHAVIVKGLKEGVSAAGRELPCILAAQLRRGDEEISMESFANAAEIEREVDIALGLSRNDELRRQRAMRLDILGSRRSDSGSWLLEWNLTDRTSISTIEAIRR